MQGAQMNFSKLQCAMQSVGVQNVVLKTGAAAVAFLLLVSALPAHAEATNIQGSEKILQPAGDTAEHDSFGSAVAISGNTMVIGADNADGNEIGAGAAYIFDKINGTWVQTAKLFAADGKAEPVVGFPGDFRTDAFGLSVAISGDTVVVGAPQHAHTGLGANSGAVYVFQRINGVWSQQAELFSPTPNGLDQFGAQIGSGGVGISGNTIVVGDSGSFSGANAGVDVFTRINGSWTFTTKLTVPNDGAILPARVAIDGNTVVVGSTLSDAPTGVLFAGAAYVFRFSDGQWSGPVALAAADATSSAQFGYSVSLKDNFVVVGAITAGGATTQSGAAYVFARDDGVWRQKAKLIASDGLDSDNFGVSVGVSGQTVLVGANTHTSSPTTGVMFAGAAFVFQPEDGGKWRQIAEVSASDGLAGGDFGIGVAILDNTLLIGADEQHPAGEGYPGGEAYVYRVNSGSE
jgi:hypothetical protein